MTSKIVKQARQLVQNAFTKTATPLIYQANGEDEYQIVYRVDNEDHLSPHDTFSWKSDDQMEAFMQGLDYANNPPPEDDEFDIEEKRNLEHGEYGDYYFGFKNIEQHNRWFTPQQIELYKANGFSLKKYKASEIRDSGKQILFLPFGGDLDNAKS